MALSKFIIQAPNRKKPIHLSRFLQTVWLGNSAAVQDVVAQDPTTRAPFLEEVDTGTGMNALHLAVGRNNLEITKLLVEAGVAFIPDAYGRMPSVIAAEMEVSEELADYICEAEIRALQASGQQDV